MKKLLIVEDEKSIRALYGIVLRRCAHSVDIEYSENGEEALSAALGSSHDLIISDIHMPVMDGISFHKLLKEKDDCKARNFAFISGNIFNENRSYVLKENIPFLEKPFKPNELVSFVDEVLVESHKSESFPEFASDMRKFERTTRAEECIIILKIPEKPFKSPVSGRTIDYSDGGGIGFTYKGGKLPKGKVVNVTFDAPDLIGRDARVIWSAAYEERSFRSGLQWI